MFEKAAVRERVIIQVAIVSVFALTSVSGLAAIQMGTNAKPVGSYQMVTEKTVSPEFHEPLPTIPTAKVDSEPESCEPYSGKGPVPENACSQSVDETVHLPAPVKPQPFVAQVKTGSLKSNIERILLQAGWESTVWELPYDYKWLGDVTITANDIQGVMTKLLQSYPLQAVFYNANHVVTISARRNT